MKLASTIKIGIAVKLVIIVGIFVCWIINAAKLFQCDWNASGNWKGEAIHGAGLVIPPVSVVTAWFDDK